MEADSLEALREREGALEDLLLITVIMMAVATLPDFP